MTAAAAQLAKPAPLPADVDSRAEEVCELELTLSGARARIAVLQKEFSAKQQELIDLVSAHGGPHAQKSKILHGIVWEMLVTFAQYTTQDAAAVERFRLALVKAKKTRLMKKIFRSDVRWTMQSSAAEIVKTEQLTPTLMSLLLQCSVTQDKKPSLDVRRKKKPAA